MSQIVIRYNSNVPIEMSSNTRSGSTYLTLDSPMSNAFEVQELSSPQLLVQQPIRYPVPVSRNISTVMSPRLSIRPPALIEPITQVPTLVRPTISPTYPPSYQPTYPPLYQPTYPPLYQPTYPSFQPIAQRPIEFAENNCSITGLPVYIDVNEKVLDNHILEIEELRALLMQNFNINCIEVREGLEGKLIIVYFPDQISKEQGYQYLSNVYAPHVGIKVYR